MIGIMRWLYLGSIMKKYLNKYTGNYPSLNSIFKVTRGQGSFFGAHILSTRTIGFFPAAILGAYLFAAARLMYPILTHHFNNPKVKGSGIGIRAITAMAFGSCGFWGSLSSRTGVLLLIARISFSLPSCPVPATTWFAIRGSFRIRETKNSFKSSGYFHLFILTALTTLRRIWLEAVMVSVLLVGIVFAEQIFNAFIGVPYA